MDGGDEKVEKWMERACIPSEEPEIFKYSLGLLVG